tara:strand:+ start:6483 stop:7415 length:933 start_codon:yes stop_codon:yes gene_type:complete
MKIKKTFIFLFFCSLIFILKESANANIRIIVKIENELITNFDVKNKIITKLALADKEITQENINYLKKVSLEELTQNRLKKIELSKYNFKTDNNQIDSYLNSISSNNISNLKNLFKKNKINFQTFIDEVDIELKWRNLIYQKYSNKIEINPDDIDQEIQETIKNQKKITDYSLSEIEILSNDINSDNSKILEIQNEILNSGFESAVIKFSIASTASDSGRLGWINSNSLSNDFLKILNNMQIGETSKPIKKNDKIIFLKLNDKRISSYSDINLKKLKENLINQKKNELFNLYSSSYLSKLRNTKFIEYFK